jgi:Leucine-rich repeat (LRR) protein
MKNLKKLTLNNWNQLPVEISLLEMPKLEIVNIRSNRLQTIFARNITSLTHLKINCRALREFTLSKDVAKTVQREINKRERGCYVEKFPPYAKVSRF